MGVWSIFAASLQRRGSDSTSLRKSTSHRAAALRHDLDDAGSLHAWVGFFVASGILAGSPIFTFAQSLPWMIRFIVAVIFLGCAFVFPWFYDQLPIYFWLTMLLAYVEVFGIVPSIPKRRTSKEERPHALQ